MGSSVEVVDKSHHEKREHDNISSIGDTSADHASPEHAFENGEHGGTIGDALDLVAASSAPSADVVAVAEQSDRVADGDCQSESDDLLSFDDTSTVSGLDGHASENERGDETNDDASDLVAASCAPSADAIDANVVVEESECTLDEEFDVFSDISDNSDLFHVEAKESENPRTDEDKELEIIESIVPFLREFPLLPVDGRDEKKERTFVDVHSGIRFPLLHCGFKGCSFCTSEAPKYHWDQERRLCQHLEECHRNNIEMSKVPGEAWPVRDEKGFVRNYTMDGLAYYMQAVMLKEQEHIPIIGPSVDRRMLALMTKALNSQTVKACICFACANVRTYVQKWSKMYYSETWRCDENWADIDMYEVRNSLWRWLEKDPIAFLTNFGLARFKERYASDDQEGGNPFLNSSDLAEGDAEWQRMLLAPDRTEEPISLLCCPEDVERSAGCKHAENVLCGACRIPLCSTCWVRGWSCASRHRIPMALANDNFFGYSTDILTRYRVRWIEAAIVSPCWTNMIIYYVEGDHGHLMNEEIGEQRARTVVRGSCVSYHMPWEDILEDLMKNCSDKDLLQIPHSEECLKYMLRVHLRVRGMSFKRHLKQVMVRPFVLVALLDFLIDRNHEVFRGKGSAQQLREKVRATVEREYPETEGHKAESERIGSIPASIQALLDAAEAAEVEDELATPAGPKRRRLINDKNATPGDGARSLEDCLEDLRPHAMCVDKGVQACSDPATLREGALERYGELHVQTGGKEIVQFHSKYFAQILPFVIPYMVSGPDYFPDQRWRRKYADAPWVSPQEFAASFGRRVEAQCRTDWTALPIIRSVAFKWVAEHTMSTLTKFTGKLNSATDTSSVALIKALQNLYDKLHHGFTGVGVHRVPIAGDTRRLPFAIGLTALEKKLAWASHFLAKQLPGTQQLRRLMGHRQFGARVVYGDCIFLTISPNEQHSAMVLRLSRFRKNDPHVKHGDTNRKKMARQDYPSLEATQCEDDFFIELPEYDLRRAYAAQDPYAVIEGYKIEILLRLATLLGIRMCPECPRCNDKGFGCQDKFGCNMRPGGGVLGGLPAAGGGTEHQGYGTPHLHVEVHVASAYQFDTMPEIVEKLKAQKFSFADWQNYQEWLHAEDVLDERVKESMAPNLEEQWHTRFGGTEHHDMSATPLYLVQDAVQPLSGTISGNRTAENFAALEADGADFRKKYLADVQRIFSRLQHHMHKKTKRGYVPLKSCQRRVKKCGATCKADFPKANLCIPKSVLVCRGIAKRFKLAVTGRRNAFGAHLGRRKCQWQSGAPPSFAAGFRSNSHSLPNWRLPPMPLTHDPGVCQSRACAATLESNRDQKVVGKLAQRVQRQCTGYYCGYTFKPQPVGRKFLRMAADSLNYLEPTLKDKSWGKQWHRITHRALIDHNHRCMRRTAPEEWNLATNYHEHDVTKAEFVRTYQSIDFSGKALVQRLEQEQKRTPERECWKAVPANTETDTTEEVWLRHFPDLYGYRGNNMKNPGVFLLSPWEFLMFWECLKLPEGGQNIEAETDGILFFPDIPGDVQLRSLWYMRRRRRPMVPAPSNTPMPDNANDAEGKARLFSVYLRPWTLDRRIATTEVPHIADLDRKTPDAGASPPEYQVVGGGDSVGSSTRAVRRVESQGNGAVEPDQEPWNQ